MREWIYGRNPVYEALRAGRRQAFRLYLAQGAQGKGRLDEIVHWCDKQHIPVERVARQKLDGIATNHQGVALETTTFEYVALQDIMDIAEERAEPSFILILDALQDPQNLGTLIRTAEITGVHGILLPLRHTAGVTPAVAAASSGACEHILVSQVNLAQAIEALKESGVWVVGLEGGAAGQPPGKLRLDGPIALVVGSEGQGMRPLVRNSCDLLLQIPMRGKIESLNAAVAGSIALYWVWQARGFI